MKYYLFYFINKHGAIKLYYSQNGHYTDCVYIGYTLKEIIRKFRQENNLRYKHIIIQSLN